MRVALLSNRLPPEARGGSEAYVSMLGNSLAARHDVLVMSGSQQTELRAVGAVVLPVLPTLDPSDPPVHKIAWHLEDQWRPAVYRKVLGELRRFRPDVVHTHNLQGLSASAFSAVARYGAPHVHTAHDLNLLCARVTMTRNAQPCGGHCVGCVLQRKIRTSAIRRRLDGLIAPSEFIRVRHLGARLLPPERAVTIPHGAAPANARARDGRGECFRLGFMGSVAPHKGVMTLLEAFSNAPEHARLTIAGSGMLEREMTAAASQDSRISYLGHVIGAEKDAFFDSLDALVVPSEWEETAALVAVEAAVRGIPSVVSDRGGLPETPEARVFRATDPASLLDALEWFIKSPWRLAEASRSLLANHERYLWSTHVRRVEDFFATAAPRGGAVAGLAPQGR